MKFNLFGYTVTICKKGEVEPFPPIGLTEQLLSKLPDFNYEWSSEAQINWLNAFGRLHDMATDQNTKCEPEKGRATLKELVREATIVGLSDD